MANDQKIFDAIIDNSLNVLRLAANQKRLTARQIEVLRKRLLAKLAVEAISSNQKTKLLSFLKETDEIIADSYKQMELDLDLPEISRTVAETTASSLDVVMGGDALKLPTIDYFRSVASNVLIQGAPSAQWWKRQAEAMQFAFATQVRQGLANGETNQTIISRIVGKNGQPGVLDIARRNAATLVQTSVQTVANDARRATFDANSDVIKGIKQVSTLDGNTSLVCISYSGAEWNLKREPINGNTLAYNGGAPRHFNCRSVEIPITKTFRELGLNIDEPKGTTRASVDGQIDVNTSFNDFLKRKGVAYQDQMLGEGRADLWRAGKITLKDLVDGQGRPLSVQQLQQKFGFKKPVRKGFFDQAYLDSLPDKVIQPFNTWEDLAANSEIGLKQFSDAMSKVAKKLGLKTGDNPEKLPGDFLENKSGYLFVAPLKGYTRALEKVTKDYGGKWEKLNDAVRGTISVNSLDDIKPAIEAMRAEGIDFVAKPKDRFLNPVDSGYRDILGLVRLPNGMNAEIQFHVKDMTAAKTVGHKFYEAERSLTGDYGDIKPGPLWEKSDLELFESLQKKQLDIYNKAWANVKKKGT